MAHTDLKDIAPADLVRQRYEKFRQIGSFFTE